ncbi:MATE family efflux transporter [Caenimonas terrae]|uniref:MATE family efflux transporter n=1 Tax=Caenimonas terrae TaxID=696074 RepID=A0ABW0NN27_9BURK
MPAAASHRPLWKTFGVFLGPLVLTNMLQALSGTLNTAYVGRMLGIGALAAVASFTPLLMLFVAFVIGLGSGASVLAGQAWGANNIERVRAIAGTVVCAGALLGAAIGVLGFLLAGPLLRLLGTPADVLADAIAYARVMMAFLPLLFVSILTASVLRGVSDTVTPLLSLLISSAVILVLTPALIRGWTGLPPLGITSGAWATVAATALSLAWIVWHLRRTGHPLAPDRRFGAHWRIEPALLRPVVRLGIPTGLFFITSSLADLALVSIVNSHGSQATAAWGAVGQVTAYVMFPAMSISITASVLAAQAIGAGRPERLDAVTRVGLGMNIALTGGLAILVALLAPHIVGLFITDPKVVLLAAGLLHISVWGAVLLGLGSVFFGVMRASGTVLVPTAITLSLLAFVLFPLGWTFNRVFGLPGIWMAHPSTYLIGLTLQALYFYGVWKHKPLRRLV